MGSNILYLVEATCKYLTVATENDIAINELQEIGISNNHLLGEL